MQTEPGVQRMWRLTKPRHECIGAIVSGFVAGITTASQDGMYVALASFAQSGEQVERRYPDGRVFYVSQYIGQAETRGVESPTLAAALRDLGAMKAVLMADGWIDIPLDPVHDPD